MDDRAYQQIADATFRTLEDAFKDIDADEVDLERSGDVITLTFKGGRKCIVNTQRPTRQIWLAANARAWHFDWNDGTQRWLDDKGQTNADGTPVDLFGTVRRVVSEVAGLDVDLK